MSILPSIITTRFPQTVRSLLGIKSGKTLALRIIDSGIALVLGCFLVTFLFFAFQASGTREGLNQNGAGSNFTNHAEASEPTTPPLGTTVATPKRPD
jgi:hypothetical protein